eukprot:2117428-Pleurochrysis_carterae.AAC.1
MGTTVVSRSNSKYQSHVSHTFKIPSRARTTAPIQVSRPVRLLPRTIRDLSAPRRAVSGARQHRLLSFATHRVCGGRESKPAGAHALRPSAAGVASGRKSGGGLASVRSNGKSVLSVPLYVRALGKAAT